MTKEDERPGATDGDIHVREHFDRATRRYLRSVLSAELIAEHRRDPPHMSEPLARLVAWCRRRPPAEQYAIKAESDGSFRLVAFAGRRRRPAYVGEDRYATLAEARHGAFLRHIKDLTGT